MQDYYTTRAAASDSCEVFLKPLSADFEDDLQKMCSHQKALYGRYVVPGRSLGTNPLQSDKDLLWLDAKVETIASACDKVPIEMLLYSLKLEKGILRDDFPGSVKKACQEELEEAYTQILVKQMAKDLALSVERGEPLEQNKSLVAYLHVLKDWPDGGSWRAVKNYAIRLYPKIARAMPEAGELIGKKFLYELSFWRASFEALSTPNANGGYEAEELADLVRFMVMCAQSKGGDAGRIFQEVSYPFHRLMEEVLDTDPDLFENLTAVALEGGEIPPALAGTFHVAMEDPMFTMRSATPEEKEEFILSHFSAYDRSWRNWLSSLYDQTQFDAVIRWYQEKCQTSSDIREVSFFLNTCAKMGDRDWAKAFLHKACESAKADLLTTPEEEFVQESALYLSGVSHASPERLCGLFEVLPTDSRRLTKSTMNLLTKTRSFKEPFRNHVLGMMDGVNLDSETDLFYVFGWICDYLSINEVGKSEELLPKQEVFAFVKKACRYDEATKSFGPDPNLSILREGIKVVELIITRETRELYRDFLYACREYRPLVYAAELVLYDKWNESKGLL